MSKTTKYDWNDSKVIDDLVFHEADYPTFIKLLNKKITPEQDAPASSMQVGQILKGKIVELTKDFVVIDVGLKSEGLVPISEFLDPQDIFLGNDVEVYLDSAEGEDGQIVLSHEKARRLRQWEFIVNH